MDETLIPQNPKPLMQNPWFYCRVGVRGLLLLHPKLSCVSLGVVVAAVATQTGKSTYSSARVCRVDSALGSLTRNGKEEMFSSL